MKAADLPLHYNAVDILERNLAAHGQKEALFSAERTMTFREVSREVNQVGNALRRLDVRIGDIVGILAPDSAEWVTAFFGILKIGAISLGMNTMLEEAEYGYILGDSRASVLLVHESLLPKVEPIRDAHATLKHVIVIGQPKRKTDPSYSEWIADEAATLITAKTHRDDFCTLNYSSGTTGWPKGIFHAHKDYPLTAEFYGVNTLQIQASDRSFAASKLFFTYGISGNLILSWYVGASMVLYAHSPRMAQGILDTIDRFKPTVFYNVPTGYINILSVPSLIEKYDLSSLRICVSAGEPLPVSLWEAWRTKVGLEIYEHIGCTETIAPFLANSPGNVRAGSSGTSCSGYEVKIVDHDGAPVAVGDVGSLMVKGETTAIFYLHQYEKSRETFCGEWLFTGDKYTMDSDGFYWHAGRVDDMFKVGGLWVSPTEVEGVLAGHPAVLECAVVGQQDRQAMVKPKAYVCLRTGYTASDNLRRDLLRYCDGHLAMHKCPFWIEFVADLPKTATGKIQRFKLRAEEPSQ